MPHQRVRRRRLATAIHPSRFQAPLRVTSRRSLNCQQLNLLYQVQIDVIKYLIFHIFPPKSPTN